MRKILILIAVTLAIVNTANAGDGETRIGINAGILYNKTLNGTITYEKELSYQNAIELYGDVGNQWQRDPICGKVCTKSFWKGYYWNIGASYKPILSKGKNSYLRLRFGPILGANQKKFNFGLEGGFEYGIICYHGMQFCITQKNQVLFRSNQKFRNGILLGVKIPF